MSTKKDSDTTNESSEMSGFGLAPLKQEGAPAHPDGYGIGNGNGYKFPDDEHFLKQLKAYAGWRGIEATKSEMCSRPDLLDQIDT